MPLDEAILLGDALIGSRRVYACETAVKPTRGNSRAIVLALFVDGDFPLRRLIFAAKSFLTSSFPENLFTSPPFESFSGHCPRLTSHQKSFKQFSSVLRFYREIFRPLKPFRFPSFDILYATP